MNCKLSSVNCAPKRIGLFGGSFNPIHCGHIGLAKHIQKVAKLDEVWFMVSPLNPLKQGNADLLDDHKRFELAQKALADEPHLKASDFEFHLPKPSYTWQTLQALSTEYPDCEFRLIIGADNWQVFDRWYHAEDILRNYRIIVYPRNEERGCTSTLHPHPSTLHPSPSTIENCPMFNVSSTEVRLRIREGLSVEGLIPQSIIEKATDYYS